ncbi:MAG: PilT/PilU family type 4a pilus ATPase [Gemmatimonadota bacterium]|jgi:twitching motility protein PilT|nr:PilT/PilU family type 4a pilus ATPase [Gemmatimonadota bacterium]
METILRAAVERGASDLHIKAGDVFRARINGDLVPLTKQRLSPEQVRGIALKLIPLEAERARIDELADYDCSWGLPGVGRFRVNILRQRGSFGIVMRVIPFEIPTLEALGLPPVVAEIAAEERGLVLVTGATGSGKSSTQAAMIGQMNGGMRRHVVTLENPIEFLHRDGSCSITQREVGLDTESFRVGLRAALRQDPDVILIGEMRDTESIDIALKAAETGHLVISTLHTRDAAATISRLIAVFPPAEQEMVRIRLAESLRAVISQRLLPRSDGSGRALAAEVMVVTGTIQDCILDAERVAEMRDHIAAGRTTYGMQTFDQSLMDLVQAGHVDFAAARAAATNPSDFELKMNTFSGATGGGGGSDAFGF